MRDNGLLPCALLITRNFPPLVGGMEKVNQHLLEALQLDYAASLCGPAGCAAFVAPKTVVVESRVRPLFLFLILTFWRALIMGLRSRPDWVIAGSGLTAPIAWFVAKCTGAKCAVYLHGLDLVVHSHFYQMLWLPFIRYCDIAMVNSNHTAQLGASRGLNVSRTHVLHPGTTLPLLNIEVAQVFRKRFDLEQRPLLLSVGRLTKRKGLAEFVENSLPAILRKKPETLLVIIGGEAVDALRGGSGSEHDRILSIARANNTESNLRFLGRCDEIILQAAYQAACLHVFPVLELQGDVEGFGMVALESAAHGLCTVAFDVGGISDAISDGVTGTLVKSGDYVAFSEVVISRLLQDDGLKKAFTECRQFARSKTWQVFGDRLRLLLGAGYS